MQEECTWLIFNNAEKENIKLQFVMDTPQQEKTDAGTHH